MYHMVLFWHSRKQTSTLKRTILSHTNAHYLRHYLYSIYFSYIHILCTLYTLKRYVIHTISHTYAFYTRVFIPFDIHLLDMSQEDDAISLGTPDDVDLYISTYEDDEDTNTLIKIQMEEKIKEIHTKLSTLNNTLQDHIINTNTHNLTIHPSIELNTIRQRTWTSILEHTSRSLNYILLEQINADITDTTHTLEILKQELHAHTTKLQRQQKRIHTASKHTSTSASPPQNTSTSASPPKTSSPSNNIQYRDIRLNQSHDITHHTFTIHNDNFSTNNFSTNNNSTNNNSSQTHNNNNTHNTDTHRPPLLPTPPNDAPCKKITHKHKPYTHTNSLFQGTIPPHLLGRKHRKT